MIKITYSVVDQYRYGAQHNIQIIFHNESVDRKAINRWNKAGWNLIKIAQGHYENEYPLSAPNEAMNAALMEMMLSAETYTYTDNLPITYKSVITKK
jgi:hypothetical protein